MHRPMLFYAIVPAFPAVAALTMCACSSPVGVAHPSADDMNVLAGDGGADSATSLADAASSRDGAPPGSCTATIYPYLKQAYATGRVYPVRPSSMWHMSTACVASCSDGSGPYNFCPGLPEQTTCEAYGCVWDGRQCLRATINANHGDPLDLGWHTPLDGVSAPLRFSVSVPSATYADAQQACEDALACTCDSPSQVNPFFGDVASHLQSELQSLLAAFGSFIATQEHLCALNWQQVNTSGINSEDAVFSAIESVANGPWPCAKVTLDGIVDAFIRNGAFSSGLHACNHDYFVSREALTAGCSEVERDTICKNPVNAVPQILNDDLTINAAGVQQLVVDVAARLGGPPPGP